MIQAWNSAIDEYKTYHSIAQCGNGEKRKSGVTNSKSKKKKRKPNKSKQDLPSQYVSNQLEESIPVQAETEIEPEPFKLPEIPQIDQIPETLPNIPLPDFDNDNLGKFFFFNDSC